MNLSDLVAYAEEKYHIHEEYKWDNYPGYSVLDNPNTSKRIALLIREWNAEKGDFIERCDIKCDKKNISENKYRQWLTSPFIMLGTAWVGIRLDQCTEPEFIYRLLDNAIREDNQKLTIVLNNPPQGGKTGPVYQDTSIPGAGSVPAGGQPGNPPDKIREMMALYKYESNLYNERCRNFYIQGMFMKDYEDSVPWNMDFKRYFPTYHDLTVRQLRGYFSWRTCLRKGEFKPASLSFAYIYLYELLNEIGTQSPEDSLNRMNEFEKGFLDAGYGDEKMRSTLRQWMLEFSVLHQLPAETAVQYIDPFAIKYDKFISILQAPENYTEEEVFEALCFISEVKLASSVVIKKKGEEVRHLFVEIWKYIVLHYQRNGEGFNTLSFAKPTETAWYPFGNAVYWDRQNVQKTEYRINANRRYFCRQGKWYIERCHVTGRDMMWLDELMRAADRKLRLYLKTGNTLREKAEEAWTEPYIDAVIEADRQARIEAARPKVKIDFSGLDTIRKNASETRESLLTKDEIEDNGSQAPVETSSADTVPVVPPDVSAVSLSDVPSPASVPSPSGREMDAPLSGLLDQIHAQILSMLVKGEAIKSYISEKHLLVSVVADTINEALWDEIGDNVLDCDGNCISLIEDYRADVMRILNEK